MTGQTISHFKVGEKLGGGGMGVVYAAENLKLKSKVALKFLPPHLAMDEEARRRFVREAQAASALNHPNICTVHDIDETEDGQTFIAMAHYEGVTLKQKLERGALPAEEALDIAKQVAQGLAAAHEKDIIHRDIKPANIFVTERGRVVILDFGLAKLTGAMELTRSGSTLGTAFYMSPEQLRGEAVDHRTDLWSLGVVLYEMIMGHRPFVGEYEQAVTYAILNQEPAPPTDKFGQVTPVPERLLKKCLAKDPSERYQTAEEFLAGIDASKELRVEVRPTGLRKDRVLYAALGVVGLLVLTLILVLATRGGEPAPSITSTRPLTNFPGLEARPSWAPDGSRLAYVSNAAGNFDIWIHDLTSHSDLNLTENHDGYDGSPAWSPDGNRIAFLSDRDGGGVFVVTPDGRELQAVSRTLPTIRLKSVLSWSPDGTTLAYNSLRDIFTVSSSGGPLHRVPLPTDLQFIWIGDVSWSVDGERIFFVAEEGSGLTTSSIMSIRRDGKDAFPIAKEGTFDRSPVQAPDGKGLYFISDRAGVPDLWYTPLSASGKPAGAPARLTVGARVGSFALTADGHRIAYSNEAEHTNFWFIPLTGEIARFADARQITDDNQFIELIDLSPDGSWLAFDSYRSGNSDIWKMEVTGAGLTQVTTNPAHEWAPNWSADLRHILFHSLRAGNRDIWRIPAGGGEAVQLTDDPAEDYTPVISPDAEHIAFASGRGGEVDIWIMDRNGKEARQLTDTGNIWWYPVWSPDSRYVAFTSQVTGDYELYTVSALGGSLKKITNAGWQRAFAIEWSGDGSVVYVCAVTSRGSEKMDVWEVAVSTGGVRRMTDFSDAGFDLYNAVTDGAHLYATFLERSGDLWQIEIAFE